MFDVLSAKQDTIHRIGGGFVSRRGAERGEEDG